MKKDHLSKSLRKGLILGLTLAFLCFAGACGTNTNDNSGTSSSSGDMAGTGSSERETGVLDQGGANGTDNDSLIDDLKGIDSPADSSENDRDGILDDLGDAAGDVIHGVESGAEDLLGTDSADDADGTGSTTGNGGATRNGVGTGTGIGGYKSTGNGAPQ